MFPWIYLLESRLYMIECKMIMITSINMTVHIKLPLLYIIILCCIYLTKSIIISLLKIVDSLFLYYCVSFYYILIQVMRRRNIKIIQTLRWSWWQCLRLGRLTFCGLLCLVHDHNIRRTIFIFLLVCNNNIMRVLVVNYLCHMWHKYYL